MSREISGLRGERNAHDGLKGGGQVHELGDRRPAHSLNLWRATSSGEGWHTLCRVKLVGYGVSVTHMMA
jgi:hypothetical protein